MTERDLDKMGIVKVSPRLSPNKFLVTRLDVYIHLFGAYSYDDVLDEIYAAGFKAGTEHGKESKIREIKKVFDIE